MAKKKHETFDKKTEEKRGKVETADIYHNFIKKKMGRESINGKKMITEKHKNGERDTQSELSNYKC